MKYLAPHWLWLLVVVGVLAAGYLVLQWRRRSTYAVRFTNLELLDSVAPKRPGWRRHLVAALFLASLALLVVALARPTRTEDAPLGPVVLIVVDTSRSMEATDVAPNRLSAAQDAAHDLVASVPGNTRLGLVDSFETAVPAVFPTTDHGAVDDAISELVTRDGTDFDDALSTAARVIETGAEAPTSNGTPAAQVVLLSDGGDSRDTPGPGLLDIQEIGAPVSTIAIGTPDATIVDPVYGETPVPVYEPNLEMIAEESGGEFFAATTAEELETAFADIEGTVDSETVQRELTTWFVGLGVVLLVVTSGLSLLWFSRLP